MKKKKTLLDLIRVGSYEEIKEALETASQDETNEFGQTPLMVAIHASYQKESEKIFQIVLDWTKDVNKKDVDGYSAFSHAVSLRRSSFVEKLLKRDVDVNVPCFVTVAPHHRAYEAYERDMALKKKAVYPRCSSQKMSPLCAMIYKSYDYFVPTLVEKGADLDSIGGLDITPLSMAIRSDKLDIVQYLLDRGANPNILPTNWKKYAKDESEVCPVALKKALKYGCGAAIALLIQSGSRVPQLFPRKEGVYSTPLTYLFSQPKEQLLETFVSLKVLKEHVDISICDTFGRSALSYAIENDTSDYIISYLMDDKINNKTDCFLKTPMMYAYEKRNFKVMEMLHLKGVPMANNIFSSTGKTLLTDAVLKNDDEMVSFMLKFNPSLLHKDADGKTILDCLPENNLYFKKLKELQQQQIKKVATHLKQMND